MLLLVVGGFVVGQVFQFELQDVEYYWFFDLYCIILFCFWIVVVYMFGGVVNIVDKGGGVVDYYDFMVYVMEQIGVYFYQFRMWIVVVENYVSGGEFVDKFIVEIWGIIVVEEYFYLDVVVGSFEQDCVQLLVYFIFKLDKGFEDYLLVGVIDGCKQCWIVLVVIFQQCNVVVFLLMIFYKCIFMLRGV